MGAASAAGESISHDALPWYMKKDGDISARANEMVYDTFLVVKRTMMMVTKWIPVMLLRQDKSSTEMESQKIMASYLFSIKIQIKIPMY